MIEIKTVVIVAVIYYISWLIIQYNKFQGISTEYVNETTFWRVLVWIAWFLMPLILPIIVVLYLIIEISKKVTRMVEDANRYKCGLRDGRTQRRYRYGKRR